MIQFQAHPLSEIFPLMIGAEFDALVADIKENGVRQPIVLLDGKILDGRNRARAADAVKCEIPYTNFGGADPLTFVVSSNVHRRHLNESQRALIAARIAVLRPGRPSKSLNGVAKFSARDASQQFRVGTSSIERARRLLRDGDEALIRCANSGAVSLLAAETVSSLDRKRQAELVASGPRAVVAASHKIRNRAHARGRSEYARLWALVDSISSHLGAGRLDLAHLDSIALSNAILEHSRRAT